MLLHINHHCTSGIWPLVCLVATTSFLKNKASLLNVSVVSIWTVHCSHMDPGRLDLFVELAFKSGKTAT